VCELQAKHKQTQFASQPVAAQQQHQQAALALLAAKRPYLQ